MTVRLPGERVEERRMWTRVVMIAMALGLASAGMSAEPAGANKTVITSQRLDFDYARSIAKFEGDVVVVDPQMRMESDRLNVIFDGSNDVKSVTASGNVRMWHDDTTATCRSAIYVAGTGEVILRGNARLHRGKDFVKGTKITFWLNEDRMTCEPGFLVVFPKEGDGFADGL